MRALLTTLLLLVLLSSHAQVSSIDANGRLAIMEEIGVPLSRLALVNAARTAWDRSFALEPGARLLRTDAENGVIEGTARVNFRSTVLTAREETQGTITYQVSIHLRNGLCTVHVHDLVHRGNRDAAGGGLDIGPIASGDAPAEHYPGMGLNASRRLHEDARSAAAARIKELLRVFGGVLRAAQP